MLSFKAIYKEVIHNKIQFCTQVEQKQNQVQKYTNCRGLTEYADMTDAES